MNIASGNLQWYDVLLILFYAALLLPMPLLTFRAQRPKKGTLEWIARYDRPRMTLEKARPHFTRQSGVYLLLAGIAAVAVAAAVLLLQLRLYSAQAMRGVTFRYYMTYYAYPLLSAAGIFLLMRRVLCSDAGALFAALIMAAEPLGDRRPVVLLIASLYCLYRYLSAPKALRLLKTEPWLYAAGLLLGTAGLLQWSLFWLLLFYAVCFAVKCAARYRAGEGKAMLLSIALACVALALALLAAVCLHVLHSGWATAAELPRRILQKEIYRRYWQRAVWVFASCIRLPELHELGLVARLLPSLLLCLGAIPVLLAGLWKRADAEALFLLGVLASLLVCWIFTGENFLLIGFALCGGYLLCAYHSRRRNALAPICALLCTSYPIAFWLMFFINQ